MISVFWDCARGILPAPMPGGDTTMNFKAKIRMLTELWKHFMNLASQEFVVSRSQHKIWCDSVAPATICPQSRTLTFPPICSPEGSNP